jgi:hypothetical protein
MPEIKYVLCRPRGGLNDMLCEIEKCRRYAEQYGRKLLIDTTLSGFQDNFWRYFELFMPDPMIEAIVDYSALDRMSTLPHFVQGNVSSFQARRLPTLAGGYIDAKTGEKVSFDFSKAYEETLLLHEQEWTGSLISAELLGRLCLTNEVKEMVSEKLVTLPKQYDAIHIRHSDYTTNYKAFLASIKSDLSNRNVLICSDSTEVMDYCKSELNESKLYRLSTFDNTHGKPLHKGGSSLGQFETNVEAITDLVGLGLSERIYYDNLDKMSQASGFSYLAAVLHDNKHMIERLLKLNSINEIDNY